MTTTAIIALGIAGGSYGLWTQGRSPAEAVDVEIGNGRQQVIVHELPSMATAAFYERERVAVAEEARQGYVQWRAGPPPALEAALSGGPQGDPQEGWRLRTMSGLAGLALQPQVAPAALRVPRSDSAGRRADAVLDAAMAGLARLDAAPGGSGGEARRAAALACLRIGPCRLDVAPTEEDAMTVARAVYEGPMGVSLIAPPGMAHRLIAALRKYDPLWEEKGRRRWEAY